MAKVILITWRNMLPRVLMDFSTKMAEKHKDKGYEELYFDDGPLEDDLHSKIPGDTAQKVKIYISGHGGTGIDYIADDTETRKKTVDELATLLTRGLRDRATIKGASANTQVNMISCLFARTPDGSAFTSPAAKLHRKLADNGIYVDLVGRTESIVATKDGRKTISLLQTKVYEPIYGRQAQFFVSKVPYTKVLHTFNGEERQIKLASYMDNGYLDADNLDGRRVLWAEHAVNRIVARIQLDSTTQTITDERQQKLEQIVTLYGGLRRPDVLKARLEGLVDGTGMTVTDNFLIHRNWFSKKFSSSEPKTASFIRELLASYPVR